MRTTTRTTITLLALSLSLSLSPVAALTHTGYLVDLFCWNKPGHGGGRCN